MNISLSLAQATALPPPPSPQANHPVSAFSVVLVILIVLGSVAMIALSSRRLKRPFQKSGVEPPATAPAESEKDVDAPIDEERADPDLLARLRRVTAAPRVERRRLGNRKPSGPSWVVPQADWSDYPEASVPTALADDVVVAEPEIESPPPLPEPIPIRRSVARTESRGATSSFSSHWAGGGQAGTIPGLTEDEIRELETPRNVRGSRGARREPSNLRTHPAKYLAPDPIDILKDELGSVVRELLFCANVGELLHGFALYSDAFLFRTMDDSGLSEEEFRDAFRAQPAKPVREWTRLAEMRDIERHADTMVTANAIYAREPKSRAPRGEHYRFVKNEDTGAWMIDDIQPLER
jgi:hypothetical protein